MLNLKPKVPFPIMKADLVRYFFENIVNDPERLAQAAVLIVDSMSNTDIRHVWGQKFATQELVTT